MTMRIGSSGTPRRRIAATGMAAVALVLVAAAAGCGTSPQATPAPPERTIAAPSGTAATGSGPVSGTDWPTYHHDNARTGAAPSFPTVGTASVAWTARLDGAVFGQPIVVGGTVYAATENDTVYALDPATGKARWSRHLGTPVPKHDLPCGDIDPLGITGTMVYDPATALVFALAESTGGHHTLYGIDATSGAVRVTRAAEPPKGDPIAHQQRSALTLLDGKVYIAYGGLAGDCANYIGSVVAVPTAGDGPVISYAVPTSREAGIWSPGGAVVLGDRLLYAVGNGESTSGYDGSDSVLSLDAQLRLTDRFSPSTWPDDNAHDLDLGSMSPAVVGSHVLIAGKRGTAYVLNAGHFGGVGGQVAQAEVCKAFGGSVVAGDTVYMPCTDGTRAVRVDPAGTPHVLWHATIPARGAPVFGGGAIWAVDYDAGVLYLLDPASGAVRQKLSIGTAPHFASPTLAGEQAYVGTVTGVVAVRPR
jgi:outer membrane protein assembly factor BamB